MRTIRIPLTLTLVWALFASAALAGGGSEAERPVLPRTEQLRGLGFLLYQLSCINVINGLHLTREQAVALRDMARELSASGIRSPRWDVPYSPDFEKVRTEFLRTREVLLTGNKVTDELRKRIFKARAVESAAIKAGLTWNPQEKYAACSRCHAETAPTKRALNRAWTGLPAWTAKEKALAHLMGAFEAGSAIRGMRALKRISSRVDTVLTSEQKAIFQSFSCCLLPPQNLSDPARIGQAASSPWHVKVLETARKKSAGAWPITKRFITGLFVRHALVAQPGLTQAQKKEIVVRVGEVLDEARSLSDMEFQLHRDDLAARLKGPAAPTPDEKSLPFMRAFFLLVPGSASFYDRLIARLDRASAARPTPRDLGREKPAHDGT
jgi:hypothetical protein